MKKKILLIVFQFVALIIAFGQNFNLKITATDASNNQPIEFANIFITPCACGGSTDKNGELLMSLPYDDYTLITTNIGFDTDTSEVFLYKDSTLNINLNPAGYLLDNITVTGQNSRQNIDRTVMGVQQLSSDKIKFLPTAIGEVDVLRGLTMLAGVGSAGEASNGLSVRGGSLDQNLVLLDYAPVFNSTHLFGLFSVFTPEAVSGVELYRSNMPSRYGGRIASVVDVKIKNPSAEKLILTGGVGFASTRLAVETPLIKNKLTLLASTRMFYNDFLFSIRKELKNTKANFQDGTIKLNYVADEKNSFSFTGFFSHDFYQLDISSKVNAITASSNQYDYSTFNGTLNWIRLLDSGASLRTTLVNSDYRPNIFFPQEDSENVIKYKSRIQNQSVQSEYSKSLNPSLLYSFGGQIDRIRVSPGSLLPGEIANVEPVELPTEKSFELSAFGNMDWTPSQKIAISLGLRYTQFLLMGAFEEAQYENLEEEILSEVISYDNGEIVKTYGGLEPRIGLRWKVAKNTSVKASYALTRQYLQNIYNSTTPLPTSRWKTSDAYIAPQTGQTYSLGIYQNLKNNKITASIEGYYRSIDNVIDYKPGADFFLQKFIEQDVVQGIGRTYGIEASFEKPKGRFNGWFNYTWSKSIRKFEAIDISNRINNNKWFNSDFDRPHVFNGTVNMKLNDFNTFSFNFTYQTGRPYTIPNAVFEVNNLAVPIFVERNNSRLPDYHRLDFSWRIHNITANKEKRWKGDWIFTIYNLYARKNVYNRYYTGNQFGLSTFDIAIFNSALVSLTYSFKFQ